MITASPWFSVFRAELPASTHGALAEDHLLGPPNLRSSSRNSSQQSFRLRVYPSSIVHLHLKYIVANAVRSLEVAQNFVASVQLSTHTTIQQVSARARNDLHSKLTRKVRGRPFIGVSSIKFRYSNLDSFIPFWKSFTLPSQEYCHITSPRSRPARQPLKYHGRLDHRHAPDSATFQLLSGCRWHAMSMDHGEAGWRGCFGMLCCANSIVQYCTYLHYEMSWHIMAAYSMLRDMIMSLGKNATSRVRILQKIARIHEIVVQELVSSLPTRNSLNSGAGPKQLSTWHFE